MSLTSNIAIIAVCVLGTMATRFLPFVVFSSGNTPAIVEHLGRVLPSAIFVLLVVYCLRDTAFLSATHGIPEVLAVGATVSMHLWRRNMMLPIAAGTVCYMVVIRLIA